MTTPAPLAGVYIRQGDYIRPMTWPIVAGALG